MLEVLRNPRLKPILALNFCNYACTFTVQGLWGGAFLREVHGLSPIAAGNVLLCAVIAYQAGMLAFGPLDRRLDTRKGIAIGGTLVIIVLLATLALFSHPPVWLPVGAIIAMGFFSASSTMVMTHGRGIFPDRLIGRGISTMNTAVMLGVACMQTLSGIIIGAFEPLASGARTRGRLSRAVRHADAGADRRGRDLQPVAGCQAERGDAGGGAVATSGERSRINPCAHVGAFSSPVNQPAETVFIGSLATAFVKLWSHFLHSNVRSSRPSGPGAIAASIMRPSHFGHPGRRIGSRQGSGRVCSWRHDAFPAIKVGAVRFCHRRMPLACDD